MNDNPKVFVYPVTLLVKGTVYVLAQNVMHAADVLSHIDLEDYIAFTPSVLCTDDEGILKINDVLTHPISFNVTDLTQLTTEEYPPNQHPDFIGIRR